MKIIFFCIAIGLGFICCNSQGKTKQRDPADSLPYPNTTLNGMSPQEFVYYNSRCSAFFDSLLITKGFNGSILVAKNNTIVYEAYCGYADPAEKKDTLEPNSAFHLASVSKTFTAMATLKLWEEGKLKMDDDLSKYFTGFPYAGVTVKSLLTHRSGLPNYLHYLEKYKWDKKKIATNQDILRSLYEMHPPLDFPTGKHFAYCNTNYALLALIIESVTGTPYGTYLQNTFFKPLQMNDTYVFTPADMSRALPSFQWNNRKYPYEFLDVVYGDKNIYSTVRDMLKWDQALYAGNLFSQQTLDSAFAPYSFEKEGHKNYGLGWRITLLDNGKKLLFHNGWWHGNNAVFIRLIDEKATIIVLSNKFNKSVYSTRHLCDLFGNYTQNGQASE